MPPTRRAPGLALLLIVGVLGVLALLSASFLTLARLERQAAAQRLHASAAMLLARSGVEDALARLSGGQIPSYGGENWDGSANGQLSAYEAAHEVFHATGAGTPADVESCPARQAMRPSFFVRLGSNPAVLPVQSRDRGFSGRLGGQAYALKVEDESAKIHVNGGFLDAQDRDGDGTPDHRDPDVRKDPSNPRDTGLGWNFQLARILNVLGQQPEVGIPGLGTSVLTKRPPGGWRSVDDLEAALAATVDLSPYLSTEGWSDPKVLHPNAWTGQPPAPSLPAVQQGRLALRPEAEGRTPVNLNAAPRPVLIALLQDLRGTSWHDCAAPVEFTLSPALAAGIADALLAARPLGSWEQVSALIDGLTGPAPSVIQGPHPPGPAGGPGYALPTHRCTGRNLCRADLVKANLDPNGALNKHLPDTLAWRWIDKSDLTVWSTEGSLGPTGTFRIEAEGRLVDRGGKLLAARTSAARACVFGLHRETTQEDFVAGRTSLDSYLSLSTDPLHRSTGDSAPVWNTWGGRGLAATTYPAPPRTLPALAADFDGAVALATLEESPASLPNCLHLNHFDDSWDADHGPATASYPLPPDNPLLQLNTAGVSPWPQYGTVPSSVEPNTLCPDGGHLESGHGPAFEVPGNLPADASLPPSDHATVSFWAKPLHVYFKQNLLFSCVHWADIGDGAPPPGRSQSVEIGFMAESETWGVVAEHRHMGIDTLHERRHSVLFYPQGALGPLTDLSCRMPGLRWHLVTAHVDTDEAAYLNDAYIRVRSSLGKGAAETDSGYATYNGMSESLFTQAAFFVLGSQDVDIGTQPVPPVQAVIDEFAVCDLLDAGQQAYQGAGTLHDNRFKIGRYYKRPDARFLSGPVAPPDGPVRLLGASWTARLPSDDRVEALVLDTGSSIKTEPKGSPRDEDPLLQKAAVQVELLPAAGTLSSPAAPPLRQGAVVGQTVTGFRYRVTLQSNVPDPLNDPVLETPWFDDITFAWQSLSGPRILSWDD